MPNRRSLTLVFKIYLSESHCCCNSSITAVRRNAILLLLCKSTRSQWPSIFKKIVLLTSRPWNGVPPSSLLHPVSFTMTLNRRHISTCLITSIYKPNNAIIIQLKTHREFIFSYIGSVSLFPRIFFPAKRWSVIIFG